MNELEEKILRSLLTKRILMFVSAKTGILDVDALVEYFILMMKERYENNN